MLKKINKSMLALFLLLTSACPSLVGAEDQAQPQQVQMTKTEQAPVVQVAGIAKPTIQVAAVDHSPKKYRNGATARESVEVTLKDEGAFTYSVHWVEDKPYTTPSHPEEKVEAQTSQEPVTLTLAGNEEGTPVKYLITAIPEGQDDSYQASFEIVVDLPEQTTTAELKSVQAVEAPVALISPLVLTNKVDSTNADVNTKVIIPFTEAVTLAGGGSLTNGNLDLLSISFVQDPGASQQNVSFTAAWNGSTNEITLTPNTPLVGNKTYTISIPQSVVKNNSGNVNEAFNGSFTTANDDTPPSITEFNPVDNAQDVSVTIHPQITFSEPLYTVSGVQLNDTNVDNLIELRNGANELITTDASYNALTYCITLTPARDLDPGQTYTLKIPRDIVQDLAGNKNGPASVTFIIPADNTAPTGVFNVASNQTNVDLATNLTVTFSEAVYLDGGAALSTSNASTIFTLKDSTGSDVPKTVTYDQGTRVLTIDPDLTYSKTYTLTLLPNKLKDIGGNVYAGDSRTFTTVADTVKPTVIFTLTSPTPSPNVELDTNIDIDFGESITLQPNVAVTIKNNSTNTNVPFATSLSADNRKLTLNPSVDLNPNTSYTVTVPAGLVKDAANNANLANSLTFTTQETDNRPITSTFYPANNATNVALDAVMSISFNKAVTPTTGTVMQGPNPNTKFILRRFSDKVPVASTLSYDSTLRKLSITPTIDLVSNTQYELVLQSSAVQDSLTNVNAAALGTFTTVTDTSNPIATYYPSNGATTFPADSNLKITFNKNVYYNGSPITAANAFNTFALRDNSTGQYVTSLTATYNATSKELTIDPTQNLKNNTSYTLSVNSLVRDSNGRTATPGSVSFTTAVDTNPPTIIVSPSNMSTNNPLNTNITLTFSEPVYLQSTSYTSYITIRDNVQSIAVPFTATWNSGTQTLVIDPTTDLLPNRLYTVTVLGGLVKDYSNMPNITSYSYFYTIGDSIPPSFTTIPVAGATNVSVTDNLSVTVSEPFTLYNGTEVTSQNVGNIVSLVDSYGKAVAATFSYNPSYRVITIDPTPILRSNEEYRIVIGANAIKDMAGNGNYGLSSSFRTAYSGTLFVSADITNGQTNVSTNRSFSISFSDAVKLANGSALMNSNVGKLVKFTNENGKNVSFLATWDATNLTIKVTPRAKLDPGTSYSIKIEAGVVQNSGGVKNSQFLVSFTTMQDGDLPTVVSSPENGEDNVPLDSDIYLQFSEPIQLANGSKLTNSNAGSLVQLKASNGQAVPYQVDWDEENAIITLSPKSALKKNEAYIVYLPADVVRGLSNNPVPSYSARFFTVQDRNLIKITTTPKNDEQNVATDKPLTVTFGEAVTLKNKVKITSSNLGTVIGLYDEDMNQQKVTFTWNEKTRTAQITPATPLKGDSTYSLIIQAGSVFTGSKKTNAGTIITFTTTQKSTPPTIKSNPKDGDKNVPLRQNIEITFGEKVTLADGTEITNDLVSSLVKLADSDGKTVASKITWSASSRKITIDPKLNLKKNQTYIIYVPAGGVSGVSGNLNEDYIAQFKTASK